MSNGFDRGIGNKFKSAFLAKQLVNLIQSGKTPSQKQLNKVTSDPVANKIFQQGLASRVEQLKSKDTRGTSRDKGKDISNKDDGSLPSNKLANSSIALTKALTKVQSAYKGMSRSDAAVQGGLGMSAAAIPMMASNPIAAAAMIGAGAFMGSKKAKAARQQWEKEVAQKRKLIEEEREEQRKQNYYNRRQSAFNNLMQSLNQAMS